MVETRESRASDFLTEATRGRDARADVVTGAGVVVLGGNDAAAAREALLASFDRDLRPAEVEVVLLDAPAGAEPGTGGKAPEGAKEIARVSGPVLQGLSACFLGTEAMAYLQDHDVEVAQSAHIMDPQVNSTVDGHFLNLLVPRTTEGVAGQVVLDLQLVRLERMETAVIPVLPLEYRRSLYGTTSVVADGVSRSGDATIPVPTAPPTRVKYAVEKPVVREVRVQARVPLGADGTAWLRRSAASYLGDGRDILVTVRVK